MISNDITTLLHTYIQSNEIHINCAYNTCIVQLNEIGIIIIITIIITINNRKNYIKLNQWGVQHHCTQNDHGNYYYYYYYYYYYDVW